MKRITQLLDNFWFQEAPASRLALLRISIGVFSLIYMFPRFSLWLELGNTHSSLFNPVGVVRFLDKPLLAEIFYAIVFATLLFNLIFISGWKHKYSGPLFGILLLFVLSYSNSWSMIFHSENLLVIHILILALTRSADVFSLDSMKHSRSTISEKTFMFSAGKHKEGYSWQYGWPIKLICTVTVISYFLAGVAKILGPLGFSWALGDSLRNQVAVNAMRYQLLGSHPPDLGFILYNQLYIFTILGIGSLLIEFGAPAAILNKYIGRIWAISAFLMHWGIFLIMGIKFRYQLSGIAFLAFFDIEKIGELSLFQDLKNFFKKSQTNRTAIVLFDGVCNFCNGTIQFILKRDSKKVFKFGALQSQTAHQILERFKIPINSLDTIILIEGERCYTKSDAILRVLKDLSGLWTVLYVFILLPRPLRDFLYAQFAKRRYVWFGIRNACFLPTSEQRDRFLN